MTVGFQPDERAIVAQQLKEESSDSTTVGLASDPWFYTPVFYPQSAAGPYVPFEKRLEWMNAATKPRIVRYVPTNPQERFDFDVRLFSEYKPDYVVVSSFEIGDLNRLKKLPSPPSEYATLLGRAEEFMDILSTDYQRWKVRGKQDSALPHDLAYIRPEIIVWKRKTDSSTPSTGSSTTFGPNEEPAPIP